MATADNLVHMERAVDDRAHAPAYMGPQFSKIDGVGPVKFRASENIWVPMEHHEYSDTATIGNPFRATKEKGLAMFDAMAEHLAAYIDEPLSAVDAITREVMQQEVIDLIEAEPRTALLVTHDLDEAIVMSDRSIVLGGPPAHVVLDLRSPVARPRTLETVRSHPEYLPLRRELWRALESGEGRSMTTSPNVRPQRADPLASTASQEEVRQRRRMRLAQPRQRRLVVRYGALALLLVAWELYGRGVNPVLFTYPMAIAEAAVDMVADGTWLEATWQTMRVLAIGAATGIGLGVITGLICGRSWIGKEILDIPISALYALPAVALIPMIVLWFGFGDSAKIFIVAFLVFFPVVINTTRGVEEVDSELLEVTRSFCSPERTVWRDLLVPASRPYVFTSIKLAIGRGLVGVIVAEFFTAISALGNLIVTNSNSFQTARTFVPIVALSLIGVLLTALLGLVERALAPWRRDA